MYFVGLDLAWGEKNQTGVAAIDSDGRLLHVGAAQDDASIIDAIAPFTGDDCLVAIDAPLIVNNPTGLRPCETALNRDFHAIRGRRAPGVHRQARIQGAPRRPVGEARSISTWTPPRPRVGGPSRSIPHPATIVLFELEKTLKYKKGRFRRPPARPAQVDDADRGTRRRNTAASSESQCGVGGIAKAGGGRQPAGTSRPGRGSRRRGAVRLRRVVLVPATRRRDHLRRLRDGLHRHAEPSTRSSSSTPRRRVVPPPTDELHERLTRLTVLLEDAQIELRTIRERLYRL